MSNPAPGRGRGLPTRPAVAYIPERNLPLPNGTAHDQLRGGPAHPFALFARHEQGTHRAQSGRLGRDQGHRRARHGRLHAPRLAGGDRTRPDRGRRHGTPAPARSGGPCGANPRPDRRPGRIRAVHAPGRNQLHLQARRPRAQGPQPRVHAQPRSRQAAQRTSVPGGQPRLRRPAHPRPGQPHAAPDGPGDASRGLSRARAHLDALVLAVRVHERLRLRGGVLRRPQPGDLRHGDRAFVGPRHELDALEARPLPHDLQLRRALRGEARPRGQPVPGRGVVFRHPQRPARPPPSRGGRGLRIPRHGGILPRGGQIPPRRPPQVQLEHGAGGDAGAQGPLPGVRPAGHPGRPAPRAGPGRSAGPGAARGPARLRLADPPARGAGRAARQRPGHQGRFGRIFPPAGPPGAGAGHSARDAPGRHPQGFAAVGRGRGAHARGQGPAQERLRRRIRRDHRVHARGARRTHQRPPARGRPGQTRPQTRRPGRRAPRIRARGRTRARGSAPRAGRAPRPEPRPNRGRGRRSRPHAGHRRAGHGQDPHPAGARAAPAGRRRPRRDPGRGHLHPPRRGGAARTPGRAPGPRFGRDAPAPGRHPARPGPGPLDRPPRQAAGAPLRGRRAQALPRIPAAGGRRPPQAGARGPLPPLEPRARTPRPAGRAGRGAGRRRGRGRGPSQGHAQPRRLHRSPGISPGARARSGLRAALPPPAGG